MIDVLAGMAGSLIVGAGFAIGYGLGIRSAKKAQPKPLKETKAEKEESKIPVTEQFENLMAYNGRIDR